MWHYAVCAFKEHYAIERQPHADCFEMLKTKVIHLFSFPFDCFFAYAQVQQNEYTLLQALQYLHFPSFEDRSCMHTRLSTAMGRSKIAQSDKTTKKQQKPVVPPRKLLISSFLSLQRLLCIHSVSGRALRC